MSYPAPFLCSLIITLLTRVFMSCFLFWTFGSLGYSVTFSSIGFQQKHWIRHSPLLFGCHCCSSLPWNSLCHLTSTWCKQATASTAETIRMSVHMTNRSSPFGLKFLSGHISWDVYMTLFILIRCSIKSKALHVITAVVGNWRSTKCEVTGFRN